MEKGGILSFKLLKCNKMGNKKEINEIKKRILAQTHWRDRDFVKADLDKLIKLSQKKGK